MIALTDSDLTIPARDEYSKTSTSLCSSVLPVVKILTLAAIILPNAV
jgi:hypothetical protein